jgi:uncharacterized membrane protein YgcG
MCEKTALPELMRLAQLDQQLAGPVNPAALPRSKGTKRIFAFKDERHVHFGEKKMRGTFLLGVTFSLMLGTVGTLADDWTAVKLRGRVLQLVDGTWQPLERGAVVPDDRAIRTMSGARVTFTRGNETIDVGGSTAIQIIDENRRRPFTTVKQYFGKVEVEAEVQAVQHFAVQTPHMAAVVKGTRFAVLSNETASEVRVDRGAVSVEDREDGSHVTIVAGQTAEVAQGAPLHVGGSGELPVVLDATGAPVPSIDEAISSGRGEGKQSRSDDVEAGKKETGDHGNAGGGNGNSGGGNSGNGNGGGNSGNGGNSSSGDSGSGNSGNGNGGGNGGDNGHGGGKKDKD